MFRRSLFAAGLVVLGVATSLLAQPGGPDPTNPFPIKSGALFLPFTEQGVAAIPTLASPPTRRQADTAAEAPKPREHRPLILVRVRVIDVQRSNDLNVSSVLDLIARKNPTDSIFKDNGHNINGGKQNFTGGTRFDMPADLIALNPAGTAIGAGSGMLVNLTADRINWIARFLARELNGDIITAPQVTTLHGEQVTFRSGANVPFPIGTTTIVGSANTSDRVVYGHVGTLVQVTPKIVNWEEKRGAAPQENPFASVSENDVVDWDAILEVLRNNRAVQKQLRAGPFSLLLTNPQPKGWSDAEEDRTLVVRGVNELLNAKVISRYDLGGAVRPLAPQVVADDDPAAAWQPESSTIDLDILVRLSDADSAADTALTIEKNVRAISNKVQVKSGHGVVMGGLIAAHDLQVRSKVPILGDIPIAGALFRSTQTERAKTETLIFVEAEVLPDNREGANGKTQNDFVHGRVHLTGELNDGPLFCGMRHAGLTGDYLPPPTKHELNYWQFYHQDISQSRRNRVHTEVQDTFK